MLPDKKELKLNHSTTSNPAAHINLYLKSETIQQCHLFHPKLQKTQRRKITKLQRTGSGCNAVEQ